MKTWRSVKKSLPPVGIFVRLKHEITGIGAPEREGWESIGRVNKNGNFSVKQNRSGSVDFRKPTHWKEI